MSTGKAIAQAGHAFVQSLLTSFALSDPRSTAYARLKPGTKITIDGGSDTDLLALRDRLVRFGIPHALIIDEGHVELPDFDGSPTITALGIGPLTRKEASRIVTGRLWGKPPRGGAP